MLQPRLFLLTHFNQYRCNHGHITFGLTTVSILVVWKANGNFARGSVSAFEIAPPSKGGGSSICRHTRKA